MAGTEALVDTPGMDAPIRAMAEGLDLRWNTRAERLRRDGARWCIDVGKAVFTATTVLVAVPAEQVAVLLAAAAPGFATLAAGVTSVLCWAVMAAFAAPLAQVPDTFRSDTAPVSWAARNSAKPVRDGPET